MASLPVGGESTPAATQDGRSGGPLQGTCVLVRSHNPTPAQIARVLAWQSEVAAVGASFWVSVDASAAAGQLTAEKYRAAGLVNIHAYNETLMMSTYPVLVEMGYKMVQVGRRHRKTISSDHPSPLTTGLRKFSVAAGRPQQSVLARVGLSRGSDLTVVRCLRGACSAPLPFVPHLNRPQHHQGAFQHVWVLEDDVGFSGDLGQGRAQPACRCRRSHCSSRLTTILARY
jgi:hypothetical protein